MKQLLSIIIMVCISIVVNAETTEIDGIYYNLIEKAKVAEITSNPNHYSGSIAIPESITYNGEKYEVTAIGEKAFSMCIHLTSIKIPSSITSIKEHSFENCYALTSISIPSSVTHIGIGAFYACIGLTEIALQDGLLEIGNGAFCQCTELNNFSMPNTVEKIEASVFAGCTKLSYVTLSSKLSKIENGTFSNCTSLKSFTISNNIEEIGNNSFEGCCSLSKINMPNSIKSIGREAFQNCTNLKTIVLGRNTKKIDSKSFACCPNIEEVYCLSDEVPEAKDNTFEDSNIYFAKLYVSESIINDYKSTTPWSYFGTISSLTDTGIDNLTNKTETYNFYLLDGKKIRNKKKGVNIIQTADGTFKKIIIR